MGDKPLQRTAKGATADNIGERGAPKKDGRRLYIHRDTGEVVSDIEQKKGEGVTPFEAMFVCRMLRSQELTILAQRKLIQDLGRENAELRRKKGAA